MNDLLTKRSVVLRCVARAFAQDDTLIFKEFDVSETTTRSNLYCICRRELTVYLMVKIHETVNSVDHLLLYIAIKCSCKLHGIDIDLVLVNLTSVSAETLFGQ